MSRTPDDTPPTPARDTHTPISEEQRAAIERAVRALPPLTDEQINRLVTIIAVARERRRTRAADGRDYAPPTGNTP
ncbi:hypothetical protein [Frankia sp. Cr1]|uniref:hypothetical protein n=1 Tax=Frankia sp. Cr1 TaxID=3073931 RepID=UPI002AD3942C|nr:hypothetical protein [Frankia sp. Cr1]